MNESHRSVDNILGWNAPHIHFTVESFTKVTEVVPETDPTPYEAYMTSIGMRR